MYAALLQPGSTPEQASSLRQCAACFSPFLEEIAPGLVAADVKGLGKLIGDPARIARAIAVRAGELGLSPQIAVASTVETAAIAARGFPGITVIPFGQEGKMLAPLPLEVLDVPDHMQEIFANWGIRTFAQLAALPERGVAERLGKEGLYLQKQARGLASRPLVPIIDPANFEQSMELEHPLELLEPLAFLLSRFLNELCAALERHGLSSNHAELTLALEDRTDFVRVVQLPTPTTDAEVLWKLLQYDLTAHPPHAQILKVHLRLVPVPPAVLQHGLFLPQAPEPQKFELILARINAVVGAGNAGSPELLNTHRPGAFRMRKFGTATQEAKAPEADCAPHLAIRIFRPALPANVILQQGRPQRVSAKGLTGTVVAWAGPWRTSGDWWTSDPWCRDEWDVAFQNGTFYRIYQEPGKGWFVEGNYD